MLKIGLTGGIASGKSTVAAMLVEAGAFLIDTDKLAREIVKPSKPAWQDIVDVFGVQILQKDQSINRQQLGSLVFENVELRSKLESITHPRIQQEVDALIDIAKAQGESIVVIDVPLLFEVGWDRLMGQIWLVYVPRQVQLERLMQRDGFSVEQAEARLNAQWPLERKKEQADVVIDNSHSLAQTRATVQKTWQQILNLSDN